MDTKGTKQRVSNEQLLAAIMAQTQAIQGLVTVLQPKATPVEQPARTGYLPAELRQGMVTPSEAGRLVAHLPQATAIPKGIKVEWLGKLCAKAKNWAISKGVTEPVFVYFVRNAQGEHKPLFARASSKASANATEIYQRVN